MTDKTKDAGCPCSNDGVMRSEEAGCTSNCDRVEKIV
jgi:hypothetical protein